MALFEYLAENEGHNNHMNWVKGQLSQSLGVEEADATSAINGNEILYFQRTKFYLST